jgi:PAS domain S-box-containing protein
LLSRAALWLNKIDGQRSAAEEELKTLNANQEKIIEERTHRLNNTLAELNKRNESNRLFIELAPSAIAMFDIEMRYLAASKQWLKDYGLQDTEIIGRSHYDIFPEIGEEWKAIHRNCISGYAQKREEDPFLRADGTIQWLTWEVRPWYIAEGEVGGLLMYTADITLQKEKEQQQRKTEEILKKTSETARIGTWEIDVMKDTTVWSQITREICEVPDDFIPVLGKTRMVKEGVSRNKMDEAIEAATRYGTPFDIELEMNTYKGRTIWVRSVGQAEMKDGKAIRVYGIFQDIDHTKRISEELSLRAQEFRSAFEYTATGMALIAPDGKWLKVNSELCKIVGYTEFELLGKKFQDITHPDDLDGDILKANQLKKDTISSYNREKRYIHKSGATVWVIVNVSMVRDAAGKPLYFVVQINNITDRKLLELEHSKTEERLLLATSASGIGIWELDLKTEQLFWDNNMMYLYGMGPMEFTGSTDDWKRRLHPEDLAAVELKMQQALDGDRHITAEFRIICDNGEIRYINGTIITERDSDGNIYRLVGTNRDITATVEATENLRVREEEFRNAFSYSAIGMALVSPKGEWLKVNKQICLITGYEEEELMKLTFQDITHMEDLDKDVEQATKLLKGEIESYQMEKRYIHKQGNIVWILLSVSLVRDMEGNPMHFISQAENITERKKSEDAIKRLNDELTAIFNAGTNVSIIGTDINGNISHFSRGAETLLGYKAEEMVGIASPAIIHSFPEMEARGKELTEQLGSMVEGFDVFTAIPKIQDYETREWTYVRKDGSTFPVQLVVTQIKNLDGSLKGFLGIATDLTQIKAAEESLRNYAALEAKNKEIEQFTYIASHDLQEPLRTVVSFVELLKKNNLDQLDEMGRQCVQYIAQSTGRMQELIKGLLFYSRIGRERRLEKVDCNVMMQQVKQDLEAAINESEGVVEVEYLPTLNVYPLELKLLFQNLLSNALKFRKPGDKPYIKVSAKRIQGKWTFAFKDNGIGIPEKYRDRIFILFQTLHNKNEYTGTGIGLAHCKKIVELHNGNIWVESGSGSGSVFYFTINT